MTGGAAPRVAVIIEDDRDIRELLEVVLKQAGFSTHSTPSGEEGVELVRAHDPLVTTLDVSLPDIDGFEVARRIRAFSVTYLVMLTARTDEIDALMGLDAGADDYQTKPFRPRELRARIEAMLRRPRRVGTPDDAPEPKAPVIIASVAPPEAMPGDPEDGTSVADGLVVDHLARLVTVDGKSVHLTRSEFDILACLATSADRVVSKNELVRAVWGDEYDSGTLISEADRRSIEVHLANLRRKLGDDATTPRWVHTVRGVGYRFSVRGR